MTPARWQMVAVFAGAILGSELAHLEGWDLWARIATGIVIGIASGAVTRAWQEAGR